MLVDGIDERLMPDTSLTTKFGGEGRMVHVTIGGRLEGLPAPKVTDKTSGLIITLLTHGDFDGGWEIDRYLPAGVKTVAACLGKAVREGGWDYAKHEPKPLVPLIPAGSSYFVMVDGDIKDAVKELHGKKIGKRTEYGYGEIAVGTWEDK